MKKMFTLCCLLLATLKIYAQCPVVDAGLDISTCGYPGLLVRVGQLDSSVVWKTNGSGIISSESGNIYYSPSSQDLNAGQVLLRATRPAKGSCPGVSDSAVYTFVKTPVVDAGPDLYTCGGYGVYLRGNLNVEPSTVDHKWLTSGTGVFNDPGTLLTAYTPSSLDTTYQEVLITLVASTKEGCVGSDTTVVHFNSSALADAGPDFIACTRTIKLNAKTNTDQRYWSTSGNGQFRFSTDTLSATYQASVQDSTSGKPLVFVFNAGPGTTCRPASDTVLVTFGSPTLSIEADTLLQCGSFNFKINSNTGKYTLTSSVSGIFSNLSTHEYSFTPSNYQSSAVYIYALNDGSGNCPNVFDSIGGQIIRNKYVSAGPDIYTNNTSVYLRGSADDSTGTVKWTTTGTGSFSVDTLLRTTYNASIEDTTNRSVKVILTASNGICPAITDTVSINFQNKVVGFLNGIIQTGVDSLSDYLIKVYKRNIEHYDLITDTVRTSYYFSIPNLEEGNYILLAEAVDKTAGYLPTYSGNEINWEAARNIYVSADKINNTEVIILQKSTPVNTNWDKGQDRISGTVTISTIPDSRVSALEPLAYGNIYLYDDQDRLLTYTQTNELGYYEFENIAAGKYQLKVEQAGAWSDLQSVTIDGNPATLENIPLEAVEAYVTSVTSSVHMTNLQIYPNPATEQLYVSFNHIREQRNISVYNSAGILVAALKAEQKEVMVDLKDLTEGFYLIKVTDGHTITTRTFVRQ